MLSRFDEYLIHQTSEPIAHPVSMDRNIYDRYWLGGFSADAALYFAASLGVYPNRDVMDCGFSVVHDGVQHAFFGSRRAPRERSETQVGPFFLEVIEPMRSLRLRLAAEHAANTSGIGCDLTFTARSVCVEENRQVLRRGRTTFMDVTRFTQFGCWQGTLTIAGQTLQIDAAQVHGIRDRSWGRRNVGEPEPGAPPAAPQVYFLWLPLLWHDHATLAVFFEDAQGLPIHTEGKVVPLHASLAQVPALDLADTQRVSGVARRIDYVAGTRRAKRASLSMMATDGAAREIALEPLLRFQMKGTGYGHPSWKHGSWKGELATGSDRWRPDELDPLALENIHIQQLVRCHSNGQTGIGVMEQVCIGPHAPSGFTRLNDGAR